MGSVKLNHLLYADDIVLLGESPKALQNLIDILSNWCSQWRLAVNIDKSKIVHFRRKRQAKTKAIFNIAGTALEVVEYYKYLGVYFDEFFNFKANAKFLSAAADRALGAVIAKYKINNNMSFSI